jgi:hypothetical protein
MKTALLAVAVLVPVLASADDAKPYVLHDGRAVKTAPANADAKTTSAFGTKAVHPRVSSGRPSNARTSNAARSSARRGILGGAPKGGTGGGTGGTTAPAPATEQGGWATPGSKILTAGQQPVYSTPAGGGTNSINGGGFVAIDQGRANDVGHAPSVHWGPKDTPPPPNPTKGGGGASGTGVTANGPVIVVNGPATVPLVSPSNANGATGATGFNASF